MLRRVVHLVSTVGPLAVCFMVAVLLGQAAFPFGLALVVPLALVARWLVGWPRVSQTNAPERSESAPVPVANAIPAEVLQGLGRQLSSTLEFVDTAVGGIYSGFGGMAREAEAIAAHAQQGIASSAMGGEENGARDAAIEAARKTLEQLLERIVIGSRLSMKAVCETEDLQASMRSIVGVTDEVEIIANRTRMLALNATIEAARVGEAGKGFAVISQEITRLAARVRDTSESIRKIVSEADRGTGQISVALRELASHDMTQALMSHAQVEAAIASLDERNERLSVLARTTTEKSGELAKNISSAITALQFQDIMSQRIQHVIDALGAFAQPSPAADSAAWAEQIAKAHTMDAERSVQRGDTAAGATLEPGAVDLF